MQNKSKGNWVTNTSCKGEIVTKYSSLYQTIRVPIRSKKTDVKTSTPQKHSDEHDCKRKK